MSLFTLLKGLVKYLGAGHLSEHDKEPVGEMLTVGLVCALKRPEKHSTRSNQGPMCSGISSLPAPRAVAMALRIPGVDAALISELFFSLG